MQNPKFGVTAFTATVLTIICVGKVLLYPYLPPSESEKLVTIDRRNAPPAAAVELKWQTQSVRAVEEATKLRKALLWVFIDPRDSNARELETVSLRDPEIVRLINRYFVPVKLNSDDHPEAERSIFPLSRVQSYLRPGASILATTTTGHLIGMIRVRGAGDRLSTPAVRAQLINIKKQLERHIGQPEVALELDVSAESESTKLYGLTPGPLPPNNEIFDALKKGIVPTYGAFINNGFCELRPPALDLLLELGEVDTAAGCVKAYATSVGYDVIGGGAFDGVEIGTPPKAVASKSVLTNAAFAETLARLVAIKPDSNLELLLDDVVQCISSEFVDGSTLFEGRVSDVSVSGLSPRFSLTGSRIDSKLTPSEATWVRTNLLSQPVPGDYLGRLTRLELLGDPTLRQIRRKLVPAALRDGQQTRKNRAYILGFVCSRLLRVHQLTGNRLALDLYNRLKPNLTGCILNGTVYRISNEPASGPGWLGSYVAVLDALLQEYLVLGNESALVQAKPMIQETLEQFGSSNPDWLTLLPAGESLIPGISGMVPDLVDFSYESTTATAIRVLYRYGSVLPDRVLAGAASQRASRMISLVASTTGGARVSAAGVIREALSASRDRRIEYPKSMVSIPQEFPLEFAIPTAPDTTKGRGIYIVDAGVRTGPYTLEEAKRKLSNP